MGSPAIASREGEGQAPTSLLSNATIFARLNELNKWHLEDALYYQARASELVRQMQEDAGIREQRARTKEEFDQRMAYRRQRGIQTRNEMDTLLDALQTNLTRDLSVPANQPLSSTTQRSPAAALLQTGDERRSLSYGGTRFESARPVGSSFRSVNETPPPYRLSSGQPEAQGLASPQKRGQDDTINSLAPPRQKRKHRRRVPVSGGRNPTPQGSSPVYHPRAGSRR